MSFGVQRYVIPLRANMKLLTVQDHKTLFQNAEDVRNFAIYMFFVFRGLDH